MTVRASGSRVPFEGPIEDYDVGWYSDEEEDNAMFLKYLEAVVTCSSERLIYFRNNYSGHWDSVAITLPKRKRFVVDKTTLPDVSLKDRLSISNEKYQDVMELTKFCKNLTAREYFENLPHCTKEKKKAK
ncbi:uncharacterized protein LOC124353257 [Homalodisca vitripennis]|uniref:uncharacterized protein LOC124353257 n=1 Tax=Homalodisca vitripennis TaxID=197043 RepID=UPI001EEB0FCB|nr:uncharacterized protein LOC124353257 [Homalodisca vitripennis]